MNSLADTAEYLRTLPAIRDRCQKVFSIARNNGLEYFQYHPECEDAVTEFCISIIQRDFGNKYDDIPPHGRLRHFDTGEDRIGPLVESWLTSTVSAREICKRLIDLTVVSVLLDAGAGSWHYEEKSTGKIFSRSEGLAICSLHMFKEGVFSSKDGQPCQVDAQRLSGMSADTLSRYMQVTPENPIIGLEGRATLLANLGVALKSSPIFFGDDARPGNMIDFLRIRSNDAGQLDSLSVPLSALWHVLIDGLNPVWPASRVKLAGLSLGDVWPCSALGPEEGEDLVPFHKLTQWMTYSLIEIITKWLHWSFVGLEDLTGLPEYRNGGLFLDLGVLTLKPSALPVTEAGLPKAKTTHPAIVEWRALTVILLDRTAESIRNRLKAPQLSLAQILESATWKGGREIAKLKRPQSGGPPIELISDGTIF